jgi:cytochrome c oxidase subunit II
LVNTLPMDTKALTEPGRGLARLIARCSALLAAMVSVARPVLAGDWGMGSSNSKYPQPDVFAPVSTPAHEINTMAWFSIAICTGIALIVGGLLLYSIIVFRSRPDDDGREPPQVYGSNPMEFAWTVIPILIVFVLILTTARTIYSIQAAAKPPGALTIRVIGHQWWWEVRYPDLKIVTANEIHVPLSDRSNPTPTFLELESADVAHSFWVPQLAGKTDLIPNKKNVTWIDPHQAGTYLGQCGEFCGVEHGLMLLRVIVQPKEEWQRWVASEQKPAATQPSVGSGREVFESTACVNCHTVQGTLANGRFGPDLTHIMSRETLGAGAALNTPENLKIWIKDPSLIKPGALMPAMNLNDKELDDVAGYLASLH